MPLTTDELNAVVNQEVTRLLWLSAHTADPADSGTGEATGSSYQRQQLNWHAASGAAAAADQEAFSVDGGEYTHYGFWDAQTGGNFLGGDPLDSPSLLEAPGTLRITANLVIVPYIAQ